MDGIPFSDDARPCEMAGLALSRLDLLAGERSRTTTRTIRSSTSPMSAVRRCLTTARDHCSLLDGIFLFWKLANSVFSGKNSVYAGGVSAYFKDVRNGWECIEWQNLLTWLNFGRMNEMCQLLRLKKTQKQPSCRVAPL